MKIGITIGDVNGIGPEVIIKALADSRILKLLRQLYTVHIKYYHITKI